MNSINTFVIIYLIFCFENQSILPKVDRYQENGQISIKNDSRHLYQTQQKSLSKKNQQDSVVFVITGGPGCSAIQTAQEETGPLDVRNWVERKDTWVKQAHVVQLDQPAGVGFSYSNEPKDKDYYESLAYNEMAFDVYIFLAHFYEKYPQLEDKPQYLAGSSTGSYLVPMVAAMARGKDNYPAHPMNLAGIIMGSSWINPVAQYLGKAEQLAANELTSQNTLRGTKFAAKFCISQASKCTVDKDSDCAFATMICNSLYFNFLVIWNIFNRQDINDDKCRQKPFCQDFSFTDQFLENAYFKEKMGIDKDRKWNHCRKQSEYRVRYLELRVEPWVEIVRADLASLLDSGVKVLAYQGINDQVTDWIGGLSAYGSLEWTHRKEFQKAEFVKVYDEETNVFLGKMKTQRNLTFQRVGEAGHMVAHDNPAAVSLIIRNFLGANKERDKKSDND